MKSWLTEKDTDAGKDWGQEEKGVTEDEMAGQHHWLMDMNLSKLQEIVKDRGDWRAALHGVTKSQDTTQRLNNNKKMNKMNLDSDILSYLKWLR